MFKDDDGEEENTFGVTRYPCMPSLVALQQMRNRLHLAFLGRKLMKWTALATGRELRRLAQELYEVYDGFAEDLRNAFILLARSRYFCPSLNAVVSEDIAKKAGVLVQQCGRTVSGVKIIQFEIFETEYPPYPHLGLEKGGQTILETKKAWLELLKRLILMMQLRAGFIMVELANRNANKKWNILSKMVIPRVNLSCQYITSELEDIEREDHFRLKRFKELKIKKQKAKEGNIIKTIPEKTDSTTGSCKSNTLTPEASICSVYKAEEANIENDKIKAKPVKSMVGRRFSSSTLEQKKSKEINDKDSDKYSICRQKSSESKTDPKEISKSDSKTIGTKDKIKPIEFIDQRDLYRKVSNRSNKCCQAESNVTPQKSKSTESKIICPSCNTKIQTSSKRYTSTCTCTKPGIDTSTDNDFGPTYQNQEGNIKSVASTCSCSQLANVKLPSDKDIQLVSSDKCCSTIVSKESKIKEKEKEKKSSSECICKEDERKPQEDNKDTKEIVESVKEIKIRKILDKDGNVRVEKRVTTTTYEKKNPLSKCCSESDMYKKPSYAGSNRTIKASKSKMKGKRNLMGVMKPCGSASTEASKASHSVTVCCDVSKNDQEVQNKSNNSTSLSASVASVDYSCSDKTISACNICSDSKPTEEAKTTQTIPHSPNNTQTENEKPKSSYCTIKIFAKADSKVPSEESNNIELTPSTLDLLRKILAQASKSPESSDLTKSQETSKFDYGTKASEKFNQKPICSTSKQEKENTRSCSCQTEPEKNILDEEDTSNFEALSQPKSVEIAGGKMKHAYTETITGLYRKSGSDIQKHSCLSKVDASKQSIIKKKRSVCSCKSKQSANNKVLDCSCSKSQNTSEQKSCACSKVQSEEENCKCDGKKVNNKIRSFSAPKLSGTCKTPKPNLDPKCCNDSIPDTDRSNKNSAKSSISPKVSSTCKTPKPNLYSKCCNKSETSQSIGSIASKKFSKCVSINETPKSKDIDYPGTKEVCTQKESHDSCCSRNKTPKEIQKDFSQCSVCGKKDASTTTRRSDRYDVRPLRLLMQSKKPPCVSSLSDSALVTNKRSKKTKLRKCISYNGRQQYYS